MHPQPATAPAVGPGAGHALPPDSQELTQQVMVVQVRMLGIEVPVGSASDSEDIWSYVDEESAGAATSALGRNGFRVGLVRQGNWNSLERILKQLAGRQVKDATLSVLPNNPLPIVLKPSQPAQTLFVFHADKTLSGEDYPPGDNLLTIVCLLNEDEPNQVILVGQPQLRSSNETVQIAEENARFTWVMHQKVYEMPDLTFRLAVPANGLVVVGPGAAARRPSSVAHQFLTKDRDGIRFETVLVFSPTVISARARLDRTAAPPPTPLPAPGQH
jgi:hypothetical protein